MTITQIYEKLTGRSVDTKAYQYISTIDQGNLAALLHSLIQRVEKLEDVQEELMPTLSTKPYTTPTPQAAWSPLRNQGYWYMDEYGEVLYDSCWLDCNESVIPRRDFLGVYRTEKEAQAVADAIKFYVKTLE